MKRLHVMCLAYNESPMVIDSIARFESQKPDYDIQTKTLVDQRYPSSSFNHMSGLTNIAQAQGWNYVRPSRNWGCHGGWNWVINELGLGEGDVLFGNDPDCNPLQSKYLDAAMDVFNNASECFTIQLNRPCVDKMGIPRTERKIGKTSIYEYQQLVAWSVGAFDCGWLKRIGGMKAGHPLYGYTEHVTTSEMQRFGAKWYILKDFFDDHKKSTDENYTAWKLACAQHKTEMQFEDWLKALRA